MEYRLRLEYRQHRNRLEYIQTLTGSTANYRLEYVQNLTGKTAIGLNMSKISTGR